MMLQTLVENAIKHGIEPKPEGGRVRVSAQVVDGQLQVEVADTGVGLQHGHVFAANTAQAPVWGWTTSATGSRCCTPGRAV
jgi:sensor histidine kinase YesM